MTSGYERPAGGETNGRFYIVSDEELGRLAASLTVIYGYGQLVRRRVLQEPTSRREDLDPALARLEDASRSMVADIHEIMGITSRSSRDTDAD